MFDRVWNASLQFILQESLNVLPIRSAGYLLTKFRHVSSNIVHVQIHSQIHFMFDISAE